MAHKLQSAVNSNSVRRDPHLQHSWNVLSGLPSDSDFVWTISHIAEPSPSEEEINTHIWSLVQSTLVRFSEIIISGFTTIQPEWWNTSFTESLTCISQGPDLKGVCRNHVTVSEGVFFLWSYRCSMGATLWFIRQITSVSHFRTMIVKCAPSTSKRTNV